MADILTPALGESVTEATIGKWTKQAGDAVKKDEVLVELETDKVRVGMPVRGHWKPREEWGYTFENITYFKPIEGA